SIVDSTVTATGLVSVAADDTATITATMSNTTKADSTGTQGGQAKSLNGVFALDEVSGTAQASIGYSSTFSHSAVDITAAKGVSVTAQDNTSITATITLGTSVTSSSSGGSGSGSGGSGTSSG